MPLIIVARQYYISHWWSKTALTSGHVDQLVACPWGILIGNAVGIFKVLGVILNNVFENGKASTPAFIQPVSPTPATANYTSLTDNEIGKRISAENSMVWHVGPNVPLQPILKIQMENGEKKWHENEKSAKLHIKNELDRTPSMEQSTTERTHAASTSFI